MVKGKFDKATKKSQKFMKMIVASCFKTFKPEQTFCLNNSKFKNIDILKVSN